ncbi:MAG: ABC transporter permease [Actinobacteria bacterium]|nr:ABC transporter permease [Actinomycetota bacterium]
MLRTSLVSLWFHRRRFVATGLAVVLGVGFLVGTRILTDAIESATGRWRESSEETDVVIRGAPLYTTNQGRVQYDLVADEVVAEVAAVDGVEAAGGRNFTNQIVLLDHDGEQVRGWQGRFVRSWPTDPRFGLAEVAEGRGPTALGELTMDAQQAEENGFELGDEVRVLTPTGQRTMHLVGITDDDDVDFGDGRPGAMAVSLEQAQALAGEEGRLDGIDVIAADGVSADDLADRIEAEGFAADLTVMTRAEVQEENAAEFRERIRFFTALLLLFSAIALFVSAFIITNTFGILVSQRMREHALLRAIGASRAQLAASVLVEAAVVGVVAGALGIGVGWFLGWGALHGLQGLGLRLPGNLPIRLDAVQAVEAVLVGLAVTLVAAALPAVRAMQVRPLTSLRAADVDRSDRSLIRLASGAVLVLVGGYLTAPAFVGTPALDEMTPIGVGLGLLLIAVIVLGPIVTRPVVALLGIPLRSMRRVTGRLAAENARRNPRRTAATVSALTVGVALVAFITVLASSAQASVRDRLDAAFVGDYLVAPADGRTRLGVDPSLAERVATIDGVAATTAVTGTTGQVTLPDGTGLGGSIAGVDPATFEDLFRVDMVEGSFDDLTAEGIVVNRVMARDEGIEVGDEVEVVSFQTLRATYTVVGLFDEQTLLAPWTTTAEGIDRLVTQRTDQLIAVDLADGREAEVLPRLEDLVAEYPSMSVQDRETYAGDTVEGISEVLNMLYALLAISLVIAFIGITNTLSLSVHERTREIGLLRAVGMARSQVRQMIRLEAVLVAVLGTTIGLAAGLGIAFTIVNALASQGLTTFRVPVPAMVVLVLGGAALGVVAALRPAARASRLDVIEAIAEE